MRVGWMEGVLLMPPLLLPPEVCRHFRLGPRVYPCFHPSPYLRGTASLEHPALWETAEIMSTNNSSEGKSVQERPKTTPHLERLEGLEKLSVSHPATARAACSFAGIADPSCTAQPAWSYSSKPGLTSRCLCLESKPYQVHQTTLFLLLKAFPIPAGIPSPQSFRNCGSPVSYDTTPAVLELSHCMSGTHPHPHYTVTTLTSGWSSYSQGEWQLKIDLIVRWQMRKDSSDAGMSMPTQERFHSGFTNLLPPPKRSPWYSVNTEPAVVSGSLSTEITIPQ